MPRNDGGEGPAYQQTVCTLSSSQQHASADTLSERERALDKATAHDEDTEQFCHDCCVSGDEDTVSILIHTTNTPLLAQSGVQSATTFIHIILP